MFSQNDCCRLTMILTLIQELQKLGRNSYVYRFSHQSPHDIWPEWMGVPHGAELRYSFGAPVRFPNVFEAEAIKISKRMVKSWVNFAEEGKPLAQEGTEWEPYDINLENMMDLNGFNVSVITDKDYKLCDLYRIALDMSGYDLKRAQQLLGNVFNEKVHEVSLNKK